MNRIEVLDHGYVELCDAMGSDEDIIRAARMSTQKGFQAEQAELYARFELHYQTGLRIGLPKEIARIGMPVGRYSKMRVTTDLLNWTKFLKLRQAPNAQLEIRQYADAVAKLLTERFPRTMALFSEGRP